MRNIAFVLLVLLAACRGRSEEEGEKARLASMQVEVEDFRYSLLPGGAHVLTGQLYNPSGAPIENAQIQVSLFDENNRRIDRMVIRVKDVPPGGRKAFREYIKGDGVHGARVRSVLVL